MTIPFGFPFEFGDFKVPASNIVAVPAPLRTVTVLALNRTITVPAQI